MNDLRELSSRVLSNGYSVIPKRPASKKTLIPEPARFNKRQATSDEVKQWFKLCPRLGLAVAGGPSFPYVAIDCDILNREISKKCLKHLREIVGSKFPTRVGLAPKWVGLFKISTPVASANHSPIEIFGTTKSIMAFGIHEDTGSPYVWHDGSPADVAVENLPEITPEQLAEFLKRARFECPPAKPKKSRRTGSKRSRTTEHMGPLAETLRNERKGLRGKEYGTVILAQLNEMEDGNRSDTLISVINSLVRRRFSKAQILSVLEPTYLQRCGTDWAEPSRTEATKQVNDMIRRAQDWQGGRV